MNSWWFTMISPYNEHVILNLWNCFFSCFIPNLWPLNNLGKRVDHWHKFCKILNQPFRDQCLPVYKVIASELVQRVWDHFIIVYNLPKHTFKKQCRCGLGCWCFDPHQSRRLLLQAPNRSYQNFAVAGKITYLGFCIAATACACCNSSHISRNLEDSLQNLSIYVYIYIYIYVCKYVCM
jgi:hypothetical protein